MCDNSDKQVAAVKQIEKLFLSIPLQKALPKEDALGRAVEQERERRGTLARNAKIREILDDCGDMEPWFVCSLFIGMESKANDKIAALQALAYTIDPEALRKHGVPDEVIHAAKQVNDYYFSEAKKPHKEGSSKGGISRSKHYKDKPREEWDKWKRGERVMLHNNGIEKKFNDKGGQTAFGHSMIRENLGNDQQTLTGYDRNWRK